MVISSARSGGFRIIFLILHYETIKLYSHEQIRRRDYFEPSERHNRILALLQQNGSISVAQLAELFKVSEVTIRKDLSYLEQQKNCTELTAARF